MPYSTWCSQKWKTISEKSAPAASASSVTGKCTVIVQRNLTCRRSTGLSHSSCSSLMSMSEDSWSRNIYMLQYLGYICFILIKELSTQFIYLILFFSYCSLANATSEKQIVSCSFFKTKHPSLFWTPHLTWFYLFLSYWLI